MTGKILLTISIILFVSCNKQLEINENHWLDDYNILWKTPSKNSSESMPFGGHSIGCNIWVENGEVLFYAQRSGSFSENNEYFKLGRFRLKMTPNPFEQTDFFEQELNLKEGHVEIRGKVNEEPVLLTLWVDALNPIVHLDIESTMKIDAQVSYENWRMETKHLNTEQNYGPAFGCFSWMCYPDSIYRHKDVVDFQKNGVMFYHRNPDDKLLFDYMIKQQGLTNVEEDIVNTQKGRTFGGFMCGDGYVTNGMSGGNYANGDFKAWHIKSKKPKKKHTIKIYTHINQTNTADQWENELLSSVNNSVSNKVAKKQTKAWWLKFWDKSRIRINPANKDKDPKGWEIARNYQLFRYQLGCNYYGDYPTKFNGGNFTFDPILVFKNWKPGDFFSPCGTPDWRSWGGGSFTAQNQRLVYWPMLKSGDFEGMLPQFDFYHRALPSAKTRVKEYWGHGGCCFTEQMENFGLPIAAGWGWTEPNAKGRRRGKDTPHGTMVNNSIKFHYESQLEFSFMILEYHRFTGNDISKYMDFIKNSIRFYDEHYQMRYKNTSGNTLDENGKLVIYPSTACESYKGATNPVDACSGLMSCVNSLLQLPEKYVSATEKQYFKKLQTRIPPLTYDEVKGDKIINPAKTWSHYGNSECPQFYPLFPFNLFELGADNDTIEIFKNTWKHGTFSKGNVVSWHQNGIFYARMGMTEDAKSFNTAKLKSSKRRFPTFWGPGHDWVPDHNWGGSGMIGLQEMLLQTAGDKILLFPAWPKEWDVDFKLHAPQNTTVEVVLKNGEITKLNVMPKERESDVIISGL
ncbi:DUF5703 domain-containing protein [Labilibacter marinus]|uniref:DUF5703 domain-containing protein n=1 Tax=Labilibacter marinus TaxID=1477105 RepID=UPI00094FE1A1|nr:DUF5703 domain-containing protein [Labilibacter marinus]